MLSGRVVGIDDNRDDDDGNDNNDNDDRDRESREIGNKTTGTTGEMKLVELNKLFDSIQVVLRPVSHNYPPG